MKKIILSVFILFVFTLILRVGMEIRYPEQHNIEFSQEQWNLGIDRLLMIEDLESNYDIKNMNREEIEELLGEEQCRVGKTSITYTLGKPKDVIYPDTEYYIISFDEDGKVERTGVFKD